MPSFWWGNFDFVKSSFFRKLNYQILIDYDATSGRQKEPHYPRNYEDK